MDSKDSYFIPFSELELSQKLGAGALGAVYRGKWRGVTVAIKRMHYFAEYEDLSEVNRKEIQEEARKMCEFRHPNIVEFYGVSKNRKIFYLIMQLHEGGDLRKRIKQSLTSSSIPPLSMEEKLRISVGVCRGLDYLQGKGIVHRDLRPGNILLLKELENDRIVLKAKICDFGLTRRVTVITRMNKAVPFFTPPENMTDEEKKPTLESDIYSLGMTLWCIFRENLPELIGADDRFFEREYDLSVKGVMLAIAKKCCASNPQNRCKIEEVIITLEKLLVEEKVKNEKDRLQRKEEEKQREEEVEGKLKKLEELEKKVTAMESEEKKSKIEFERKIDELEEARLLEKEQEENERKLLIKQGEKVSREMKSLRVELGKQDRMIKVLQQAVLYNRSPVSQEDTNPPMEMDATEMEEQSTLSIESLNATMEVLAKMKMKIKLELAHNCLWGLNGERIDYYKPHKLYEEIVNYGGKLDANANWNLGKMYFEGYGVKEDETKAEEYYKKAAEFYSTKKVEDLKPNNWSNMGWMYVYGDGFEENEKKGVDLLKKAVERGSVLAMWNLGECYQVGIGVERSNSEAFKFYSKAAEVGLPKAMNNLGFMYGNGYGVKKDKKKALKLYREAAKKGERTAMYNVGLFYKNGFGGVEKNLEEAKKWYKMASNLGDEDSRKELKSQKSGSGFVNWIRGIGKK